MKVISSYGLYYVQKKKGIDDIIKQKGNITIKEILADVYTFYDINFEIFPQEFPVYKDRKNLEETTKNVCTEILAFDLLNF